MFTPNLSAVRGGVVAALIASGLALGTVAAPPASAATWDTATKVHGAKLQFCKVKRKPRVFTLRMRLVNKAGDHRHRGFIYANGVKRMEVRARAGRISKVKAIRVRSGFSFVTGVGEINGPTAGGGHSLAETPRC